jgi:hypothetical protein
MKRITLSLAYLALLSTAFGSFVGESIAGNESWATVKASEDLSTRRDGRDSQGREAKRYAVKFESWTDRERRWRGVSLAVCVPALIVWLFVRTEAAAVCFFLCVSLALLSLIMRSVFR